MERICLYRAVSLAEWADLVHQNRFRSVPGSLEGKWFAETESDAREWGKRFYVDGQYKVIQAWLPKNVAESLFRLEMLDNIGPAVFAEIDELDSAILK